jgi:signal transduction histidine kinase/ActR/RegA family two-component response regulator
LEQKFSLDIDTVIRALNVLGDGVAIYDANLEPVFVNDTTRRRFCGMHSDMDAGMSYQDAQLAAVRRGMPGASEEQVRAVASEMYAKAWNGINYTVLTDDRRIVEIQFQDMGCGLRAAVSVDITDHHKREKELAKAKKAAEAASQSKSAFLANMSHEIRTPLNGIMGMAQVLESTNLDQQQRDYLTTILESGKTLMSLLNDVLDLSKIEAGKFDISPTDNSLAHILRRQLNLWQPGAEEKGLELSLAFDADLPLYLSFDAVRVQQCVSNLVSNAVKFTSKGRVEIFAKAKPIEDGCHQVEIRVRDTGPGMDAETLGRLFKPFAQADESTSRKFGGTGLGLSITRRLAELMGGNATAESQPGRGSTFTISFRCAPANAAPTRRVSDILTSQGDFREQLKQSNLRILLVDDHPINRQVASLFLKPFNTRIVEAANGLEALEALRREPFDIVLLDMHMPVMDGPTAIAKIRSSGEPWAGMPVIALTADAMSGDRERYLSMGMTGYLAKPLAERELLSEIARVCAGSAAPAHRRKSA